MDLAGIGSIISGIGSIAGIFKKKDKPDYAAQAGQSLKGTVEMARQLGLHPLAALGHSMATPWTDGNSIGDQIGKAGEAISRAGEAKLAAKIAESEIQRNDAETAEIRARTETLKLNAARALIGGPGGPVNYGSPSDTTKPSPGYGPQNTGPYADPEKYMERYDEAGAMGAGATNLVRDAWNNLADGFVGLLKNTDPATGKPVFRVPEDMKKKPVKDGWIYHSKTRRTLYKNGKPVRSEIRDQGKWKEVK